MGKGGLWYLFVSIRKLYDYMTQFRKDFRNEMGKASNGIQAMKNLLELGDKEQSDEFDSVMSIVSAGLSLVGAVSGGTTSTITGAATGMMSLFSQLDTT